MKNTTLKNTTFLNTPWRTGREDCQTYDAFGKPFTNVYSSKTESRHHVTQDPLYEVVAAAHGDNNKQVARLIAAAPELLEACKAVLGHFAGTVDDNIPLPLGYALQQQLRLAVRKADGIDV